MADTTRRQFLESSTAALASIVAAALSNTKLFGYPFGLPVGLQLYTVRAACESDLGGTLKKVAAIGYRNVEVGGTENYWGRRPGEVRRMLCDNCLVCVSTPCSTKMMESNWQKYIDEFSELGALYAVCPGLAPSERNSLDTLRRMADLLNKSGEQCQKSGLRLAYHCHNVDFQVVQGVLAFDELLQRTDPKYLDMEMDCFWTTLAGKDPVAYFKRYPGRFALLHIKDLKPGFTPTTKPLRVERNPFAEVGRGIINWRRIFAAAHEGGLRYYMVEQDQCDRPPFESIKISYDYLRALNG